MKLTNKELFDAACTIAAGRAAATEYYDTENIATASLRIAKAIAAQIPD